MFSTRQSVHCASFLRLGVGRSLGTRRPLRVTRFDSSSGGPGWAYSLTFSVCLLQILQKRFGPPWPQFPLLHPTVLQLVHLIAVTPVRPHEGQGFDFCQVVIQGSVARSSRGRQNGPAKSETKRVREALSVERGRRDPFT